MAVNASLSLSSAKGCKRAIKIMQATSIARVPQDSIEYSLKVSVPLFCASVRYISIDFRALAEQRKLLLS